MRAKLLIIGILSFAIAANAQIMAFQKTIGTAPGTYFSSEFTKSGKLIRTKKVQIISRD